MLPINNTKMSSNKKTSVKGTISNAAIEPDSTISKTITKMSSNKKTSVKGTISNAAIEPDSKITKMSTMESIPIVAETSSPNRRCIVCVRGHVDTGKTSLVSKFASYERGMRSDRLTEREAGGITQEVGLTTFSCDHLRELLPIQLRDQLQIDIGVIDTPGHEAFESIRAIGSQIAHITLVMVDVVKGIDADTLSFLQTHVHDDNACDKTIIVLNKIDKISGFRNLGIDIPLKRVFNPKEQSEEFIKRLDDAYMNIQRQLSDISLYGEPYYKKRVRDCIAYIPISAHTGAGISDLLLYMSKARMDLPVVDINQGFILDKRNDSHLGKVLIGVMKYGSITRRQSLKIGDSIFPIRNLYQNQENRDSREHCFVHTDLVTDATSFAIVLQNQDQFEFISTGSDFEVVDDTIAVVDSALAEQRFQKKASLLQNIGVHVSVPSESMIDGVAGYFTEQHIKMSNYSISRVTKKDLIKLNNICDKDSTGYSNRHRCILICIPDMDDRDTHETLMDQHFNTELQNIIRTTKISVIFGGTIYRLADNYNRYLVSCRTKFIRDFGCYSHFRAQSIPKYVFRTSGPILMGVKVTDGVLAVGCIIKFRNPSTGEHTSLGRVSSISLNKKDIQFATKDMEVCLKIDDGDYTINKTTVYELVNQDSGNGNSSSLVGGDITQG